MNVKDQIIAFLVKYGIQAVGGLIIFVCGLFVAGAVGRVVKKSLTRFKLEPPLELLIVRGVKLIIIVFALILTVANFGVNIAPLVAGMGVVGVGIGLAMQGVLANFVAGLVIIFTKPFRVGEYIELVGESGVVNMIDLLSTRLSHFDKSIVVIPNRKIIGEIFHNYGVIRQLDLAIGVNYDSDLRAVERAVRDVLARNPKILKEPAAGYGVTDLDDSSINIAIKPWVSIHDFPSAPGELYQAIVETFREQRIQMPFPQREIRILNYDASAGGLRSLQDRATTGI